MVLATAGSAGGESKASRSCELKTWLPSGGGPALALGIASACLLGLELEKTVSEMSEKKKRVIENSILGLVI